MKTALRLLAFLILLTPLSRTAAAQTLAAFSCDGTFYQIRQVNTTSSLYRVDRSASTYTTVPVNVRTVNGVATNDLGVLLNGLAYNSQDGYMYALSTTGNSTTLPTSIQMYRIGQDGITDLGTISNMPNIEVASGTIDKNGRYYVSSQNSTGTSDYNLYRFDLNSATPLAATVLRLRNATNSADLNITFYDLAFNPKDNLLYGVYQNGTLWRIDQTTSAGTNQALVTVIKNTATTNNPVGTSFFDVAGDMFVYTNGTVGTANSGGFYQVNLSSGAYTSISSIDPASVSDGASCINPDQRIDVVKEVTSIATTATALRYNISFAVRVKNTGTVTDDNVQVSDFLKGATNSPFPSSATINSVSNLTVTNQGFNPPSLAANTAFNGQGTSAYLLTGNHSLTAGQNALITFTVDVTFASAPTAILYNSAYASSTSGTAVNHGYTLQTAGTLLAPPGVTAVDQSTNGAGFSSTANGDTPSGSPIALTAGIFGDLLPFSEPARSSASGILKLDVRSGSRYLIGR